uniref:Small nuclear RNA activating complex, polypeptide 4 n=1 Tax=Oryzias latipes TaxID=8090 RepID=A0A3B3H871_ORYLA
MKTAAAPVMRLVPSFSAVRLLFNFWSHHLFLFFCVLLQSDLGLTQSVDSCLQLNLVYQQVMQETLDQLEVLLKTNQKQQEELIAQMSGPYKESSRGQLARSTYQQPVRMFLGRFLKPYFKDKLTGLGPPANEETKQKALRMAVYLDDRKLKQKRWESWQKTLLIHSVARDGLKRLIQPKLSKVDYLSQKLSGAKEADKQSLREQILNLEDEIEQLREKKEEELIGSRYEEHDWQKISNIDFEGTKEPEDIRLFWQNFLHPSINKKTWSKEEVQQLKEVSARYNNRHWETIAQELGMGRTGFMCLQVFQRFVSRSLKRGSWTPEEDALLKELVNKMRIGNFIPYTQISYFIEGRDPTQLLNRWTLNLDPSLKKGAWTKEEDKLLLRAVSRLGETWWKVRMEVPGRSIMACRERYHDCLKAGLKKGPFNRKERELLRELVDKHGVGRWAKIAAEIPNRLDCQCLREWKKLTKCPAQRHPRGNGPSRRAKDRKAGQKTAASKAKKGIRRRLVRVKEEELTEEEDEDEDCVIPYMDSDDEIEKKEREETERVEEKPYVIPPMKEWVPTEKAATFSHLCSSLVVLPPMSDGATGKLTRSTILGKCGRSVILGPCPRELPWEERHKRNAMIMFTPKQLQVYLTKRAHKVNASGSHQKARSGKRKAKETNQGVGYELQAAVAPWIGNLLIATTTKVKAVDILRENAERSGYSSTSFFLLLLQAENVDVIGCKEIIENRKNKVVIKTPTPSPSAVQVTKSVIQILQQRKRQMEQQDVEVDQHSCITQEKKGLQSPPLSSSTQLHTQPHNLLHMPPQTPHGPISQIVCIRPQILHNNSSLNFTPFTSRSTALPAPKIFSPAASQVCQRPNAAALVPSSSQNPAMSSSSVLTGNRAAQSNPSPITAAPSPTISSSGVMEQMEAEPTAAGSSSSAASLARVKGVDNGTKRDRIKIQELTREPQTSRPSNQTSLNADSLTSSRPPITASSESSALRSSLLADHNYTNLRHYQTSVPLNQINTSTDKPLKRSVGGRKRQMEVEQLDGERVGDAGAEETQAGKRRRQLSEKGKAHRAALQAKMETKQKNLSSRSKKSPSKKKVGVQASLEPQPARVCMLPTRAMWVMTPAGLVPMAKPQAVPMTILKGPPCLPPQSSLGSPLPPTAPTAQSPQSAGLKAAFVSVPLSTLEPIQPSPAPPTSLSKPLLVPLNQRSSSRSQSPPNLAGCEGVIKRQSGETSPIRSKGIGFDPSLMFQEPQEKVHDWLSGRGGVPAGSVALPYLPPFVSTLNMMTALLLAKKSLTQSSLDLLPEGPKPRPPQAQPISKAASCSDRPPPNKPGSTSDCSGASNQPAEHRAAAPAAGTDEQQREEQVEEEQVRTVRRMVAERFSTNPAYQLLKARFLSSFTLPALLATMPQVTNEEMIQEVEDEEQPFVKKKRGQRSGLLSEDSDVSASHFSGISTTSKPRLSNGS